MSNQMPDRDPTLGELRIMFSNIMDSLRDVRDTMATKEFVNTKFDAYNDRVNRLEADFKEWRDTSIAEHVRIDAESNAQNDKIRDEIARQVGTVQGNLNTVVEEQKAQQEALKSQRNGRAQAVTIAILGSILSVVGSVIASGLIRGLFPIS